MSKSIPNGDRSVAALSLIKSLSPPERQKLFAMLECRPDLTGDYAIVPKSFLTLFFGHPKSKDGKKSIFEGLIDEAARPRNKNKPPKKRPQFADRDGEILRLHALGRTPGQIYRKIKDYPAWSKMENGKAINVDAVKAVLQRAKKK